ncbi:hypothetical protein PORY_001542 [Pneumocystis oryctolagi]|uniref:Uncharacterized protein n=1 Tax=Pneumocystis oryctolagi TaxID=42067 RepID=A0ACB7CCS3_9ASCO|nr:hypothetical protein PORY_001542 [Pneumocystis oryctolagi]
MAKPALKASKEFIILKDYKNAILQAKKALGFDPLNYNAYVFLGISYFNLSEFEESENAYKKALEINEETYLAWKGCFGFVSLYSSLNRIDEYIYASVRLATIFMKSDEKEKCFDTMEKLLKFVEERGSHVQILNVLESFLPSGPFYIYLEGLIPNAGVTYAKIINILENLEKEKMNKAIAKQRGRLGFTVEDILKNVKKDVFKDSTLEKMYEEMINWEDNDELRRKAEAKLLNRCYEHLKVIDLHEKQSKREKVLKLAHDMIIVKNSDILPWMIVFEWEDFQRIDELDINIVHDFISLFPDHPMTLCLQGVSYLYSKYLELSKADSNNSQTGNTIDDLLKDILGQSSNTYLDNFIEAVEKLPDSVFCHRFLASSYFSIRDYANVSIVSKAGLNALSKLSTETGLSLPFTHQNLIFYLAISYVHYKSPKFHNQALELFDEILKSSFNNVMVLHGKAIVLEERKDFSSALNLLLKAAELEPNNILIFSEIAWCEINIKKYEDGSNKLDICIEKMNSDSSLSNYDKAEICWKKGIALWEQVDDDSKKAESYSFFITSLKYDSNYSRSFVNLGIFYADVLNDENRSMKCFQKAFELNAGEFDAAERLVITYAKKREWDLVETIAKIVLSANKIHRRYCCDLSWPQRSLGIAEMNHKRYDKAIIYFQSALKIHANDSYSWAGLGEAYAKSGKYIAALKALNKFKSLDKNNWFVQYLMGDVQKLLGLYKDACESYYSILEFHPDEFVVVLALSETYVSWGFEWKEKGFYKKSEKCIIKCLKIIKEIKHNDKKYSYSLWTILSKACFLLSSFSATDSILLISILNTFYDKQNFVDDKLVAIIDNLPLDEKDLFDNRNPSYLLWAFLFMKRAVKVSVKNKVAHLMSWYSLGQILFLMYLRDMNINSNWINSSVYCLKRAIKMDPKNATFWRALGVATSTVNPKISQYSLVRSLKLDQQNPITWGDLATLYMINGDFDLAYEAFMKSQVLDPDYWVPRTGLGFISTITNDIIEAKEQFEISFINSSQNIPIVNYLYVSSSYDYLKKTSLSELIGNLATYIFAIQKYLEQRPTDCNVLILMSLLLEMNRDWTRSIAFSSKACEILEKEYEENENPETITQFLCAKSCLSRVFLADKQYERALESSQIVLNLTEGYETSSNRLSCHLVAGISLFYLNKLAEALEMFQNCLVESNEHPDVIVLLCKILWAMGGQEERDIARQQLLECISQYPNHVSSLLLLGSIGLLNQDTEIETIILKRLYTLDWNERKNHDPEHFFEKYLELKAYIKGDDPKYMYLSALNVYPSSPVIWTRFASIDNSLDVCSMALKIALRNPCSPEILSLAYSQMSTIFDVLKALHLAPWVPRYWEILEITVFQDVSTSILSEQMKFDDKKDDLSYINDMTSNDALLDASQDVFEKHYMDVLVQEFEDELDELRKDPLFSPQMMPILVSALKKGVNIFSAEEKQKVLDSLACKEKKECDN